MRIKAIRIDVTKITKDRLYVGKTGAKYLDAIAMELDEPDRFGNTWMIVESVTKEERMAGKRGPILGNMKDIVGKASPNPTPAQRQPASPESESPIDREDSVPF